MRSTNKINIFCTIIHILWFVITQIPCRQILNLEILQ